MPASYTKPDQVEQRGRLLVAIPRGRKDIHGDYREEFRIALDEYEGHAYIALRVFERGIDGRFYPVKNKGCSVRLGEAQRVADAILGALELADSPGGGGGPVQSGPPRSRLSPRQERLLAKSEADRAARGPTPKQAPRQLDAFDDLAEWRR